MRPRAALLALLALLALATGAEATGLQMGHEIVNVARNKTCTQSTAPDWHNCTSIINGNTHDGAWSVAERSPWMSIDLDGLFFVDHIVVWNAPAHDSELQDFYVQLSNTSAPPPPSADTAAALKAGDSADDWSGYIDYGFDRSVSLYVRRVGRYVRLARFLDDAPGTLSVGEVEVFGYAVHQNVTGCLTAASNAEACSRHGACRADGACDCDFGFAGADCESTYLVQLAAASSSAALIMGVCACGLLVQQRLSAARGTPRGGGGGGAPRDLEMGPAYAPVKPGKRAAGEEDDEQPLLFAREEEEEQDDQDEDEPVAPCSLALFFASPLAHVDHKSQVVPVDPLNVEAEWRLLRDSLEQAGRRDVRMSVQVATVDSFRSLVTLGGFSCIHFSGHCHPDYIAFEDGAGGAHLVSSTQLRELFRAGEGAAGIQFVFINSCYSLKVAQQFADAGVPHVVASRLDRPVTDEAAVTFTRAFYLALAVGKHISSAFAIATQAVSSAPGLPAGAGDDFVLLGAADHDVQLWPRPPARARARALPPQRLVQDELPVLSEDFVGRSVDVFKIVKILSRRQLVSVCAPAAGDRGIGKSSVAVAVARHVSLRRVYRHGVFFVSLKREPRPTVEALQRAIVRSVRRRLGLAGDDWPALLRRLKSVHCVLVLDHVDDLVARLHEELCGLLGQLIETSPTVKLVLTSHAPLSGQALLFTAKAINYRLAGLGAVDAARLFVRRSSHTLRLPAERDVVRGPRRDRTVEFLADHPAIQALRGHPVRIVEAASRAEQIVPELCVP